MGPMALLRKLAGGGGSAAAGGPPDAGRLLVVGSPNVGKSALFNALTGRYVVVSNYPGTTVEVARGRCRHSREALEVVDTPGMYGLVPITEEERVARRMLLEERPRAVIHVVDSKNLGRMLGFTLQLAEAGLPVVVALNMADEAADLGIRVDAARLAARLGVPVVPTVATRGEGARALAEAAGRARPSEAPPAGDYGPVLEEAIAAVAAHLGEGGTLSRRTRALLLLQGDAEMRDRLRQEAGPEALAAVDRIAAAAAAALDHAIHYHVALAVRRQADALVAEAVTFPPLERIGLAERLSRLVMRPLTGLPVLAAVLYFGLYQFVGRFGAGTLVNWIEGTIFGEYINPYVEKALASLVPWPVVRDLFGGEYGIVTLGLRYAVAIVLPIVGTFFLVFSVLEDSGYLPRLAMLLDRLLKKVGLNGRAVIPMVLGFGCDTMATMVTRTLETRRERIIATLLLALAVPCSAQMGVILGLLAGRPAAMAVWAGVVTAVFLAVGALAARVMPGRGPSFYMELPPLRLPRPGNVLVKTYTRMVWYLREVLPLFILASVFIWIGRVTGLFEVVLAILAPVLRLLGLPGEASVAFLFGFFRRDYGAAGLYDLHRRGLLSGHQLAVAAVVLTLFLPCVAQFLMMKKEHGWRVTLLVSAFILAVAFAVGWSVHAALVVLKVQL